MKKIRISPVHFIPLSFVAAIVLGTLLLMIPAATAPGNSTDLLTALFTATTSVCVTGLVVVDTYAHWSLLGQIIMLLLVQIGGLGVVAVASMIMILGKRKFSLGDRILLENSLNVEKNTGLLAFLKRVFKSVFITEGIGAVLYAVKFVPLLGPAKGIWASVFQSVSAFCNAGMDVIGPDSMIIFNDSPYLMILTMILITLGGLGFVVWFDVAEVIRNSIRHRFSPRVMISRLSEHSKLVLVVSAVLVVSGAAVVFFAEYSNPDTMGSMTLPDKIMNSFFQSVTFRTAGFASVPQDGLTEETCFTGFVLMFIGGSPVGTAGGVKTVTAVLFLFNALSYMQGKDETTVFRRRVTEEMMRKASAIVFVSMSAVFIMISLLMAGGGIALTDAAYEIVSALSTVGLSRNLTSHLDTYGRIIVIVSMYLGRIGPISMAVFFSSDRRTNNMIRHSEGEFYVG
ncbi:potassium transporter TrkG [Ruminococcus sp. HUN007]|uniref:TrkH family potassium uptake protein n=1 Tax=Ruminococcus sp. HUN007 TaxID=1514668 RepID=UPI0005D25C4D|nr:potassium transporter TrkG [Ruminococcus sp. HUN007]